MKTIIGTLLLIALVSISISSANSPPSNPATLVGPISGTSGTSYTYSTSATDPDGGPISCIIEWGDGSKNTTSGASGATVTASHVWIVPAGSSKTFSLRAKATDADGLEANCWSSPLSVTISGSTTSNNPPQKPDIPSGSLNGESGIPYRYSTKATDPDGDQVKYTFDWGDGTTSTTTMVGSGIIARAVHVWTIPAGTMKTFDVRAKATDEHGAVSAWSNAQPVIIAAAKQNHPPSIPSKPVGPTSGVVGQTYSYSVMSTDEDGDSIKYSFDFGDGGTWSGYLPSGQTVTVSHTWLNVPYGKTWTYQVRAYAVDSHQAMSPDPIWSEPLVVSIKGPGV